MFSRRETSIQMQNPEKFYSLFLQQPQPNPKNSCQQAEKIPGFFLFRCSIGKEVVDPTSFFRDFLRLSL